MTLNNKTSAILHDAGWPQGFKKAKNGGIDAFGGKAEEEQTILLRMQRFLSDHAGEVLTNIAPQSRYEASYVGCERARRVRNISTHGL